MHMSGSWRRWNGVYGQWLMCGLALFSVGGKNATMPLVVLAVTTYNAEERRFRTTWE